MSRRFPWLGLAAVALSWVLDLHHSHALSLCTDGEGRHVLTDSPAQFLRCTAIESPPTSDSPLPPVPTSPSASGSPAGSAATSRESSDPSAVATSVAVPVERLGGLLIVTARLNRERPARLILDTGASHTLLSHRVAQELGLFSLPPVALVTLQTAGGSVQAEIVRVDSIQLAGAEVRQSLAAIHDMPDAPPGIEGLLGQSFLREFEVTVNADKGEVRLRSAK